MASYLVINPLLGKSMDWFLYDNGLHHERVKESEKHTRNVHNSLMTKRKSMDWFLLDRNLHHERVKDALLQLISFPP